MTASPRSATRHFAVMTLWAVAVAAPLLSIYAPLGMAPLALAGSLLIGAAGLLGRQRLALPGRAGFLILAGLLVWTACSLLWTINPGGARLTLAQLAAVLASAALFLAGAALTESRDGRRFAYGLSGALTLAIFVYAIELAFGSPIRATFHTIGHDAEGLFSPFNRGLTVLMLLTAPAAIMLRRQGHGYLAAALLAAMAATVYAYHGTSLKVALTVGLIAASIAAARPKAVLRLLGVTVALAVLACPFVIKTAMPPETIARIAAQSSDISAIHRLVIWNFAAGKILERPLTGWGLDSARVIPDGKTQQSFTMLNREGPYTKSFESLPLHTHNMALQWWLELGAAGAALCAAFLFWLFRRAADASADRVETVILAGQIVTAAGVAGLSYGIWQAWWLTTLMFAAALTYAALRMAPARTAGY